MKNKKLYDKLSKAFLKTSEKALTNATCPMYIGSDDRAVMFIETDECSIYLRIEPTEGFVKEEKSKKKRGRPKKIK